MQDDFWEKDVVVIFTRELGVTIPYIFVGIYGIFAKDPEAVGEMVGKFFMIGFLG